MKAAVKLRSDRIPSAKPSLRIKAHRRTLVSEIKQASSLEEKAALAAFGHKNPLIIATHGYLNPEDFLEYVTEKRIPFRRWKPLADKIINQLCREFLLALQQRNSKGLRELADYLERPANPYYEEPARTMVFLLMAEMEKNGGQNKFAMTIAGWREILLSYGAIKPDIDAAQLRRLLKDCNARIEPSK